MAKAKTSKKSGARKSAAMGTEVFRSLGTGAARAAQAPPLRTAYISLNSKRAVPVQYLEVDDHAIFEGDIVLGTVEQVERQSAILKAEIRGEVARGVLITGSQYRWPNCVIPYDIDATLTNQARVTDAIQHWEDNTRFSFVLRTAANAAQYPDWVTFRPASGCSSAVGRRGGQQFVNLGTGCSTGNAIHEIGHVVGLWHEQSREDRDAFVTINYQNIISGYESNFNQHVADGDDIGAYDYGSIMHYPRDAFSANGNDTITPVDATAVIGQRTALSSGDIAAANSMCLIKRKEQYPETIKEQFPETSKEQFPETIKERHPETVKEQQPETIKEQFPETLKERQPETIKEQHPETIKEQQPETLKEQHPETIKEQHPETIKEQQPETIKEQFPETIKEQQPETIKEQHPETLKEKVEPPITWVENISVRPTINPGITATGGAVPFAVSRPTAGAAVMQQAAGAGNEVAQLQEQLGKLSEALLITEENQGALLQEYQEILETLAQLGVQ